MIYLKMENGEARSGGVLIVPLPSRWLVSHLKMEDSEEGGGGI
jgi:hypothetical protein